MISDMLQDLHVQVLDAVELPHGAQSVVSVKTKIWSLGRIMNAGGISWNHAVQGGAHCQIKVLN